MGATHVQLALTNVFTKTRVEVRAMVDTGSSHLVVTHKIAKALGFDPEECRTECLILADGSGRHTPVIGPVAIQFEDRQCSMDAYVMGDECLLGFIALECMDLVVDPKQQRLVGKHPGGPVHRVGRFSSALPAARSLLSRTRE
jgi:clan AA aspartic protease